MKRFVIPIIFFIIFLIVGTSAYFWWRVSSQPVSPDQENIIFVVSKGKSASQVAESLYEKNLIKNPLAFKLYVQLFGKQKNINAGEFILSSSMNLKEIIDTLQGRPVELWVTVPEGLRREQIVEIFIEALRKSDEDELQFRKEFMDLTQGSEGYLFPDTYLFPPDASAEKVVEKLLATFETKTENLEAGKHLDIRSFDEIVTMASIVERETKSDEERPIVAGILWKRLETSGWLLQADATVQYVVGFANCKLRIADCNDWWPVLTKKDLEIDSPYNSYIYDGLPPSPIANAGLSSIGAALKPVDSDYWYYIHGADGQIHYGRNLEEHNRNIKIYLGK